MRQSVKEIKGQENKAQEAKVQEQEVRGYAIKRAPLGAYLVAVKAVNEMPKAMIAAAFPGKKANEVLAELREVNIDGLCAMLMRAVAALPEHGLKVIALLLGLPENKLKNDPAIGLDGLAEMVEAWLEINGAEELLRMLAPMGKKVRGVVMGAAQEG